MSNPQPWLHRTSKNQVEKKKRAIEQRRTMVKRLHKQKKTVREIARACMVSKETISQDLRAMGLKWHKDTSHKDMLKAKQLERRKRVAELYHKQGKTRKEIAEIEGVSTETINVDLRHCAL